MTSSLVGSEMCIRDSPRGDELATAPASSLGRALPLQVRPQRLSVHPWHCLLYTSDAADDM
eukprot:2956365-Prorocentrum_lima.AAC.1